MTSNIGLFISLLIYLGLLFFIAGYASKRRSQGKSLTNNAVVYSLCIAVYCTDWTFYGSVGRAAREGFTFLPIYIGPTLMFLLASVVLKKIVRISKLYSITSIADFISSRYGKSSGLGGFVAIIAVFGVIPYIALQIKSMGSTINILLSKATDLENTVTSGLALGQDYSLLFTLLLIPFTIYFGVRNLDSSENREGLMAVIAFEAVFKLVAFLCVGVFVVFGLYNGVGDLFSHAVNNPQLNNSWSINKDGVYEEWFFLTLLSMPAIIFLPRQFQVTVVENMNEDHIYSAIWMFPLYLFLINLFVLPIALAGKLHLPAGADADWFVLTLPMAFDNMPIATLAFFGGISAATGMIIMETVALSNMICNSLIMPLIVKAHYFKAMDDVNLNRILLRIRQGSVVFVLIAAYFYFRATGKHHSLVSTGLISFLAVAQFAPSLIGGIFWKGGTRIGALWGLAVGFGIWFYTMPFGALIEAGLFDRSILDQGLWGIEILRPHQLFGLDSLRPLAQATFWSLTLNLGFYVGISLWVEQSGTEKSQANLFVDVLRYSVGSGPLKHWQGTVTTNELRALLSRFLGKKKTEKALRIFANKKQTDLDGLIVADSDLLQYTENLLSGAIGTVSARIMVSSVVKEEPLMMDEVMDILDATQQVILYSQQLEQKSDELEKARNELRNTNIKLKELDLLRDDFIGMITHELRTPLTSIRAFSEILHNNLGLETEKREEFLGLIIQESVRLTRLINRVLDSEKMESGNVKWNIEKVSLNEIAQNAINSMSQLAKDRGIRISASFGDNNVILMADHDRLIQVMVNFISNAIKFCPNSGGVIEVIIRKERRKVEVQVKDNGIGVKYNDRKRVFEKFRQVQSDKSNKYPGSGLGLSICKRIIEGHNGKIGVYNNLGKGATFYFSLPSFHQLAQKA
ncbi:MAG: histidine kinase [Proteobacteria bacterium]|nr:histidine kinase [Pseudomonadota bacterium]